MTQVAEKIVTDIDTSMRHCTECNKDLPLDRFGFIRKWQGDSYTSYIRNQCKTCRQKLNKRTKKPNVTVLKPPRGTPEQCGSCNTTIGNILGDVDIATSHKYGYLCAKCYKLARDFQSDAGRIRSVLDYIENTR